MFDINFLYSVPGGLATFLLAMSPIFELRGSIPVGIGVYDLSPMNAYLISVVGNIIPVIFLLLFLQPVANYLMRFRYGKIFFDWLFSRTYRKHAENHRKYGLLALIFFVSLPLPVTGAWTGSVIAFLFGLKFKYAFPAIVLGIFIAGAIVTTSVMGIEFLIFR